jgi:FkbH-like protein
VNLAKLEGEKMPRLTWLPQDPEWKSTLKSLPNGDARWASLQALANSEMDFVRTGQLDRQLLKTPSAIGPEPIRLGLLSSSTVDHLLPSLRVAALRRGLRLDIHVPDFGQYRQALLEPNSMLAKLQLDVLLFALDAHALVGHEFIVDDEQAKNHLSTRLTDLASLWRHALSHFGAQIIQQTLMPTQPSLMGSGEYRAGGSPAAMINTANAQLRALAVTEHIDILALDDRVARDGIADWHNKTLWNHAKQDVSPAAAPMYGEMAMRIIAARRGRSAKCLVLDLDNTLWGGVIGDDGLDGIVIGQGGAQGEAYLEFQRYVKALAQRGIILAVCSKNDESNAVEVFEKHPEMILRRSDIAAFVANWDDKAANIRRIALELNIGTDSLVFADDNSFERNIIRRELPEVKVPEMPEDPALFSSTLADAGYFEAVEITKEDLARNASYQVTRELRQGLIATSDIAGYLDSLDMELVWGRFDSVSLKRVTQLVNKTNQFNLTTRRYSEPEIAAVMRDPDAIGLHFRLIDRYADHGIIAALIGRYSDGSLELDNWLMSCRVLGRGVEKATLSIIVSEARRRAARIILGRFCPSSKNGMVRDHYPGLGFSLSSDKDERETLWTLDPQMWAAETPHIRIREMAVE